MDHQGKLQELESLRARVRELEAEIAQSPVSEEWAPTGFYWSYYATSGFLLGGLAAIVSLMVNVIGAPLAGKNPLELIRIYLTFPLGEKALDLTGQAEKVFAIPDGVMMTMGCCLYVGTGMLLGVPLYAVMMYVAGKSSIWAKLTIATFLSLGIWLINFYGILSWLQPLLFQGNWITDNALLPWWVAAVTHLVFGWTLALIAPLGEFRAYANKDAA